MKIYTTLLLKDSEILAYLSAGHMDQGTWMRITIATRRWRSMDNFTRATMDQRCLIAEDDDAHDTS